ncbi:DUF4254 domain-containing protein [Ornithobacterium rhinotracheale]|uniref:DUF4254 domain-containing protein n=1 Tax=Ornithobacterium rhinotracheale TaxID=28251 RepID=UPI001FF38AC6|nr:DUF4254 domain-containing protein [Ornithobacterium rhinotracheale]MCK0204549.1 DUF4254 domain-containing protein [Ornithobacterium rhinotracheale]
MNLTENAWKIFEQSIKDYHVKDDVYATLNNPYESSSLDHLLYRKNWIDTVQWHLEDIIRDPEISPEEALKIKRWIDQSNQERTDTVEYIDSWFLNELKDIKTSPEAKINTESPAWAIDRFSILALKIYHMREEANRADASEEHRKKSQKKLDVLLTQKEDLGTAIEELITDLQNGTKKMKVYKQMKMYNDEEFNPVLYKK